MIMIKTTGNKERLIVSIGVKENKVDSILIAKELGAEYVGNVGANPHSLPLSKEAQERLAENRNVLSNDERNNHLVAVEIG